MEANGVRMVEPSKVLTNSYSEFPIVQSDLGEFHISFFIRGLVPIRALADTGSSDNVMPFKLYYRLELQLLEPIKAVLSYADNKIHEPLEIVKNIEVKVGFANFLVHFIVMDMGEESITHRLLGISFLSTARANIDYRDNTIVICQGPPNEDKNWKKAENTVKPPAEMSKAAG
ncbi:uncharacterized protein [Rutidosis leptorrhynchoides]|uniref:uncharacterized protein n=1 Tax=Rutidosis leptorrhynchoides TaxID=125765 RepID=UPI003A999637